MLVKICLFNLQELQALLEFCLHLEAVIMHVFHVIFIQSNYLDAQNACRLNINTSYDDKGSSCALLKVREHHWLISYPSLSPHVESLLRMKDETAEVDEFTFSQGTSDQESNGSGSYYIKQEPWGHKVRREWDELVLDPSSGKTAVRISNLGSQITLGPKPQAFYGVSTRDGHEEEGVILIFLKNPEENNVLTL